LLTSIHSRTPLKRVDAALDRSRHLGDDISEVQEGDQSTSDEGPQKDSHDLVLLTLTEVGGVLRIGVHDWIQTRLRENAGVEMRERRPEA
jgi:hypothetical protein